MNLYLKNISVFIVLIFSFSANCQTTEDIKKEADGFFDKEQFVEATSLYLQLLNVEPRNHELNFKYGACLLYSAQDKSEAIRFLNFSVKSATINPIAHYYLGKAFHLNFEFTKAITAYSKFKEIGSQSDLKKFNVQANIDACKNGKQLLTNITDMIVINKTEVRKQDFYELYKLNNIGGSLLITDQFQSKIDKKLDHRPIIYFPQNSPYIFYSSYGEDGNNGLDIYVKQKLPNGKWSNAVKVVGDVNTELDEDYPFLSLDGKYLYYSSKGHNSMGGYDVFRSKVIVEGSSFAKAENMDFAVSSPNDDILYIVDSLDRTAYFSSARESQDGKLYVYEVRVEKIPMQLAVLKGDFSNEIDPGNRNIKIEVINFATGVNVGTFNSSPNSGSVLMTIPKSGKYIFEMSVKGSSITHRAQVSVPFIKEFRPLKVDLVHKIINNEEVIIVKTKFDDKFDDPTAIMADVYQRISKLDPNANKFNLDSLNELRNADDVFVQAGIDVYSTPADIQELLAKAIDNNAASKQKLETNSFLAHNIAERKQAEAKTKIEEANKIANLALSIENDNDKKAKLTQAYKVTSEAERLHKEAIALIELGDKLDEEMKLSDKALISLNTAMLDIKAVSDSDGEQLTKYVQNNSAILALASNSDVGTDVLEQIEADGNNQRIELNRITEKIDDLKDRKAAIEANINNTKTKIAETKKKKEIETLENQIQSSESELDLVTNEIERFDKKLDDFYSSDVNNVVLVDAVLEIKSEVNQTEENKKNISNTQKLKIKYSLDDEEFREKLDKTQEVFAQNNITGESIDLTNLNKSTVVATNYKTAAKAEARIEEILLQLASETNETEKIKLQKELESVNAIREERLKEEAVVLEAVKKSDLIEDFNSRQSEIIAIKNVEKQKSAQAKLNKELKQRATDRINNLPPSEDLTIQEKSELQQLKEIVVDADTELARYDDWKVAVKNKDNSADFTYEDALSSANSTYENRLEEIQNSTLTEGEKADELKVLNANTLTNAKEKLQEAEATLSQDSENELAVKQQRQYSRLISELETNQAIPLVDIVDKEKKPINEVKLSKAELLPSYQKSISKIESSAINELDKEKAKLNVNSELLVLINAEIQTVNATNQTTKSKEGKTAIEELEKIKSEVENEIASSEAIINKKIEEDPSLANSLESIAENYTASSYSINELTTDAEKMEAIKKLNAEAIVEIDQEIKKTKIANATNPRDELLYEIQELNMIKKELEANGSKDYYGVVNLASDENLNEIKGGTDINEIEPEFQLKLESIAEDAISRKDLERKKIDLYESTMAKTNREIRRVQNGVNTFPENKKQLEKRAESLTEIKRELENKIYESKAIAGEDVILFTVNVDVEDANPTYLKSVQEIKKIENVNDRENAVLELNRETVGLIAKKVTMITEDIEKNGQDSKKIALVQKYRQLVAEIEANPKLPAKGSVREASAAVSDEQATTETNEFPVIYKNVEINEALPSYKNEIDSIINSLNSVRDKEISKIELYDRSIAQLQLQAKELETYSRIDSPNKSYAEEKLKNIKDIIEVLQSEKEISQNNLENIQNPQVFVGISDIMPDYETRKEKIEYDNLGVVDKLQKTNELNKVLIFEIDKKVSSMENLQKEEFSLTRSENIEKLRELSNQVTADLQANNAILKVSEQEVDLSNSNDDKFEPLNPDNFKQDLEVSQLNLIKKDVKLIESFEKDIARLNRKKARLSGNDAAKVQKEIDKTISKQTTIHNRLMRDLEVVIDEKLWVELNGSKENSVAIKGAGMYSEEIRSAEEGILIAEAKIEKAKEFRREALTIKNQVVANKVLLKATKLEYDAQQILEKSNATLTTAAIVSELTIGKPVILKVDESPQARTSSALYKIANDIERRAFAAEARAGQLADSVYRVKKKYRNAILIEVEEIKAEEKRLLSKADDIRARANEIENQEKELFAAKPTAPKKDIPKTEQLIALKSTVYSQYFEEYTEAQSKMNKASEIQSEIDLLKAEASRIVREAIVEDGTTTMEEHQSNPELLKILSKIDSLTEKQRSLKQEAIASYQSASSTLNNASESKNIKESIAAMVQRNIVPDTAILLSAEDVENTATASVIGITNTTAEENQNQQTVDNSIVASTPSLEQLPTEASSDFIPPNKLNGQLFRITQKPVYSTDNPIPVDGTQPKGLVYKVQVGAFRNPLPPQSFDKFAPISGEELSSGVTRYMVGYFTNFSPANNAKTEIRGIKGYSDAFVVAYYNGEKITIARAKELEEVGVIPDNSQVLSQNVETNIPNNVSTGNTSETNLVNSNVGQTIEPIDKPLELKETIIKPVTAVDRSKIEYYTSVPNAAEASQVEIINGLFYTVQIGVYSKPVPAAELFNVSPLNSQLTKSGKVRYSTGIYTDLNDAVKRKNDLINIGIVDAFVTAYFNGERISIMESKNILKEKGDIVFTDGKTISEVEGVPASRYDKDNIYYRILLGKYESTVPANVANYLFNDDNIFFETEIDVNNTIYLYTQKFYNLSDVKKGLVEINELGFEDMEILSFYNIQIIPFEEAQTIINNEPIDRLSELETLSGINADKIFYEPDAIYYRVNIEVVEYEKINTFEQTLEEATSKAFDQELTTDGKAYVHSENISSFIEAQSILDVVKRNGVEGAQLEAFHKYTKITVQKAKEIKGR